MVLLAAWIATPSWRNLSRNVAAELTETSLLDSIVKFKGSAFGLLSILVERAATESDGFETRITLSCLSFLQATLYK